VSYPIFTPVGASVEVPMFEVENADALSGYRASGQTCCEDVEEEAIPRVVRKTRDSHSRRREMSKSPQQKAPAKIQLGRVMI
jgi:hypothetical protein